MAEEVVEKFPNLDIANWKFLLAQNDEIVPNKQEIRQKLLNAIKDDSERK